MQLCALLQQEKHVDSYLYLEPFPVGVFECQERKYYMGYVALREISRTELRQQTFCSRLP